MAKPQILGCQLLTFSARDRNCRSIGNRQDRDRHGLKLDIAGLHIGVPGFLRTQRDRAGNLNHVFLSELARSSDLSFVGPRRVERHLEEPRAIPQIEKHDPAEISHAMNPASNRYVGTCVGLPERAGKTGRPQLSCKNVRLSHQWQAGFEIVTWTSNCVDMKA